MAVSEEKKISLDLELTETESEWGNSSTLLVSILQLVTRLFKLKQDLPLLMKDAVIGKFI